MLNKIVLAIAAVAIATVASAAMPMSAGAKEGYGTGIGSPMFDPFYKYPTSVSPGYSAVYSSTAYGTPWYASPGYRAYAPGYRTYAYAPLVATPTPHVAWCMGRYRSYQPATDTFTGYDGNAYACRPPF